MSIMPTAVLTVPTWDPTTENDKETKRLFLSLSTSTDKVVLVDGPDKPIGLNLRSKAYFDLKSYVMTGKDFPTSDTAFDKKIAKAAFAKLTAFDDKIYDTTKETMVSIGSTCKTFYDEQLAQMVQVGAAAVQFCNNTLPLLETADGINLRHNLNIVMDEKYTSTESFDQAFKDAREAAEMVCGSLAEDALAKKTDTDRVLKALVNLRNTTKDEHLPKTQWLIRQYRDGPVDNKSANHKTPYLKFLNKDLADNIAVVDRKIKESQKKYERWQQLTGIAIVTAFIVPFGWLATPKSVVMAGETRGAYEVLEKEIAKMRQERKDETDLISFVTSLMTQFDGVVEKMDAAVNAIQELSELFNTQAKCFDGISTNLKRIVNYIPTGSLPNRKSFIMFCTDTCIAKLKDLEKGAGQFSKEIIGG